MKIDLHCHTKYSYDSNSDIEKIIIEAKKKGIDGIAITDHDNTEGWTEAIELGKKYNFLIILGEEIKSNKGDILGLFLKEKIEGRKKDPRFVMEEIKKQGGLVVIPHPFHYGEGFRDNLTNYLDLIDAIEVFNARKPFSSPDKMALDFAKKNNTGMTAGSDSHYYKGVGYGYTESDSNTLEDFKISILEKRTIGEGKKAPIIYIFTPLLSKLIKKIYCFFKRS